jgi:hypothetical protein
VLFFEKKETKKLLLLRPGNPTGRTSACAAPNEQKFFASFFQKRSLFLPLPYCPAPATCRAWPST